MTTYLVAYDLVSPGQNYEKISKAIRAYGTHAKVLESTWIIKTTQSAVQVRDNLKTHIDSNDKLIVLKVGPEGAWRNLSEDVSTWLKKHLK